MYRAMQRSVAAPVSSVVAAFSERMPKTLSLQTAPLQIIYHNQNLFHTFIELNDALEVLFVLEGLKPACRQLVHEDDVHRVVGFCESSGLYWELSDFKILKDKELLVVPEYPGDGHYFVYLSRSKDVSQLAKFYEATRNDALLGDVLGYPQCCVRFYLTNYARAVKLHDDYTLMSIANTHFQPSFVTNNMARFFSVSLISHFPCSYNCPETEKMGSAFFECIKTFNPSLAAYVKDVLQGPVISHASTGVHLLKGANAVGSTIWYKEPWLTSPNEMHATLRLCNNIKYLGRNHIQLCQDDHMVEDVSGDHVGFVMFE